MSDKVARMKYVVSCHIVEKKFTLKWKKISQCFLHALSGFELRDI